MPLHELLESAGPGDLALVDGDGALTFAELTDHVRRMAAEIGARSEPGDRVAVIGANSVPYVVALYAVPAAGRVLVLLNQRLGPVELRQQLVDSGATMIVGDAELVAEVWADRPDTLVERHPFGAPLPPAPVAEPVRPGDDAVAWLIFTSGTTGRAKGAMLSHGGLLAAAAAADGARSVAADEVYLYPFPLCHVAAYNVLVQHRAGRPVVLVAGFEPGTFVDAVERHGVTSTSLAPTMMTMLLEDEAFDADRLTTLRRIGYGASPISEPLLRRITAALPDVGLSQGYGMTELSGNAVYLDAEAHRRALVDAPHLLGAAGRPAPGVELRLARDGEILVRAPQTMAGYWGRPDTTAEVLVDGWLHTGDVGRFDDEGYLYVVDRKKDIIVTGGENVASREVVDVVVAHPDVVEAAVVGVPDPRWGEAVCAVVVGRGGAPIDPEEIVQLCRDRLASYKKPRHVLQIESLPKNAGGKILNRLVRDWAAGQLG